MEKVISRKEVERLENIKGKTMGNSIKNTGKFILEREGEEGLRKLEETMASLGHPIKYDDIRATDFYPSSLLAITFLAMKRVFDYSDEDFREMGRFRVKFSLIIRLFMKYFVSLDKAARKAPTIWRNLFTTGNAKVAELNKEEGYAILRVEDYRFHPLQCRVIEGIFPAVLRMILKKEVSCKETKCIHKGDDYHDFLIKW